MASLTPCPASAEPFDEKMKRLTIELDAQFRAPAQLEQLIRTSLQELDSEE